MPIFETREQLLSRMNEALGDRTDWRKRYRDTFFGTPDPNLKPDGMSDKSKSDPAKGIPGGSENNPSDFGDLFSAK